MIAYADKSTLRSGQTKAEIPVGERSDLVGTHYREGYGVQSSEGDEADEALCAVPDKDDSVDMEFVRGQPRLRERFRTLVTTWREECGMLSSTTQKAMHPAYQQIIGMGSDVLPLIFEELDEAPGHWFWALRAITGEDPVPPQDVGDVPRMSEVWLHWGRERGYL